MHFFRFLDHCVRRTMCMSLGAQHGHTQHRESLLYFPPLQVTRYGLVQRFKVSSLFYRRCRALFAAVVVPQVYEESGQNICILMIITIFKFLHSNVQNHTIPTLKSCLFFSSFLSAVMYQKCSKLSLLFRKEFKF